MVVEVRFLHMHQTECVIMHNIKGAFRLVKSKGPGKRGHIAADTLLPTQMLPRLLARATFVADPNFVSRTQKMFLILFRNILCPQFAPPKKHHGQQCVRNNVSSFARALSSLIWFYQLQGR